MIKFGDLIVLIFLVVLILFFIAKVSDNDYVAEYSLIAVKKNKDTIYVERESYKFKAKNDLIGYEKAVIRLIAIQQTNKKLYDANTEISTDNIFLSDDLETPIYIPQKSKDSIFNFWIKRYK